MFYLALPLIVSVMNTAENSTTYEEIDRFDGGVGWIADPKEVLQRASHALAVDGDVWVVDPVDVEDLDELLSEFGTVRGVVLLLDRHKRDAATIANRHDVPVYLPHFFVDVAEELDAPVEYFGEELDDTGYQMHRLINNRFWQEAALYHPEERTLLIPEAVGTTEYFLAEGEALGVHPGLRMIPPRQLRRFEPKRILVGHGSGIHENARRELKDALRGSRWRAPEVYLNAAKAMLPF